MDRKDRERELTSALLAALSPQTISEDQMSLGFTRLLASVEVGVAQALRRVASRLTLQSVMMRQVEGSNHSPRPMDSTALYTRASSCAQQAAELLRQNGWASSWTDTPHRVEH